MSCHVCGSPSRFTIVMIHRLRPFDDEGGSWERAGVAHCRANPAHDTGEPYLSTILARRAAIGDAWAQNDTWQTCPSEARQ